MAGLSCGPRILRWLILQSVALSIAAPAIAQTPLDLLDGIARNVLVQVETSGTPGIVGQSFGPELPATYSATGNIGTLVIPATSHEQMVDDVFPPVPGSYTPITIEFDLTTFEAISQAASGANGSGQIGGSFTQKVLDSTGLAGFMGPSVPPLFCTSQAQVDQACMVASQFCGQVCNIVPGEPYDPATGLVNLVGIETVFGCDGPSMCFGPFDNFATRGDLMLSEAPPPSGGGSSGGGGDDNPCFIATAAYGTPLAGELNGLRAFRDTRLLPNPLGAAFTDAYYRLSPPLAAGIAGHDGLRKIARWTLVPLMWIAGK